MKRHRRVKRSAVPLMMASGARYRERPAGATDRTSPSSFAAESGSADLGVPGMASMVDRVPGLAVQWQLSEAGVAGVRDALVRADLVSETSLPPRVDVVTLVGLARARVVDDVAADLVWGETTVALATVIAAERIRLAGADPSLSVYEALRRASARATGVSGEELDRRGRAFGLRSPVRFGAGSVLQYCLADCSWPPPTLRDEFPAGNSPPVEGPSCALAVDVPPTSERGPRVRRSDHAMASPVTVYRGAMVVGEPSGWNPRPSRQPPPRPALRLLAEGDPDLIADFVARHSSGRHDNGSIGRPSSIGPVR